MADTENKEEKKLEVNLIKKEGKPESQAKPAAQKKKVVVKRKPAAQGSTSTAQTSASAPAKEVKKEGVRVVKKAPVNSAKTDEPAPAPKADSTPAAKPSAPAAKPAAPAPKAEEAKPANQNPALCPLSIVPPSPCWLPSNSITIRGFAI